MCRCNIIIPVWNRLQDTKSCINAIKENTSYPYTLILIDNASGEPTASYLQTLEKGSDNIMVIRNETNEGFVRAVNKGIKMSDAPYICLLNNDTFPANGWLTEMASIADNHSDIGIINPSSNTVGEKPEKGETVEHYAERLKVLRNKHVHLGTAIGFCMFIKREVISQIGLFDEMFDMGNYEDTDFSLRAAKKGYKIVRALASYVYHKEGVSFKALSKAKKKSRRNKELFEKKWGKQERVLFVLPENPALESRAAEIAENVISKNGWIYVASKKHVTNPGSHSRIQHYCFKNFFFFRIFLKVAFKKKRFDRIYCANNVNLLFLQLLRFCFSGVQKAPA